jgi:uncharacterized membrane protein HdeD (DUF308 family)
MIILLSKYWCLYVVRGVLAILFGLAAFFWPGITLRALVMLFGFFVLLQGLVLLFAAFGSKAISTNWWIGLLEGIVSVLLGLMAFVWPGITAIILLFIIAAWAFFSGVIEFMAAVQLRRVISGEWVLGLTGILSITIALLLVAQPGAGAVAVTWLIGLYAFIFGALLLYLGVKIRNLPDRNIYVQGP